MRRPAPAVAIPPSIFKHFAAVTIILTAGIALFASGESREAMSDAVEAGEAKSRALQAQRAREAAQTKPATARKSAATQGTWGSPAAPSASASGGGHSSGAMPPGYAGMPPPFPAPPQSPLGDGVLVAPDRTGPPGAIGSRKASGKAAGRVLSEKEAAAILAASRKRSGAVK